MLAGLMSRWTTLSLVRELQRAARLLHDAQHARQRKRLPAVEQRLHALAFHQFHGDVVQAVFFARVVHHHDVGMGQQTGCARLGLESRQQFGTGQSRAFFAQFDGFDRDRAPNHRVCRLIDHTHGAAAQLADNFVTSCF